MPNKITNNAVIFFLLIVSPVVLMALFSYVRMNRELNNLIYDRRESIAFLAAHSLDERFEDVIKSGRFIISGQEFRRMIERERWGDAIESFEDLSRELSYIDRVVFTDPSGKLMSDISKSPGMLKKNFIFRSQDKKGKSEDGHDEKNEDGAYVSEIYQQTAGPKHQVVDVVLPIKSLSGELLAVAVLQVRLDHFLNWTKEINVGEGGFIYFVDQKGNVAGHPEFPSQGEVVNFAGTPAIDRLLGGNKGIGILDLGDGSETMLIAYYPLGEFGWGAVVAQPTKSAFKSRDSTLMGLSIMFLILFILDLLLAVVVVRITELAKH